MAAVAAGEDGYITITVPPGAKPGDILTAEHGGETIETIVPPNARPGDAIQIQIEFVDGDGYNIKAESPSNQISDGYDDVLVVTVPPGAAPGDPIILDHDGRTVEFVVPAGARPGDEIEVTPEELTHRGEGDDGTTMVITVPPGAAPGDPLTFEHNGRTVEFVVPSGVGPGDEIKVKPEELDALPTFEWEGGVLFRNSAEQQQQDSMGGKSITSATGEGVTGDGFQSANHPASTSATIGDGAPHAEEVGHAIVEIMIPYDIEPGADSLTFEVEDGRRFSLPIPEGAEAGDILSVQLPDIAPGDVLTVQLPGGYGEGEGSIPDSAVVNISETMEEGENGTIVRTTVEEREDGTIIKKIQTTSPLPDGHSKVETETIIEKPRKHKTLREKRQQMLEWKKKMDEQKPREEAASSAPPPPRKPKPKPEPVDEMTAQLMLADADDFYTAGEVRAGGRYTYKHGLYAEGSEKKGQVNPYMPHVKPALPDDWYEKAPEPKEEIDVEESRKRTMSRSAAITQFEEDRAAIFDEDGNERPSAQLVIALEAAAIVATRKAEGGNVRLNALVARDECRLRARVLEHRTA